MTTNADHKKTLLPSYGRQRGRKLRPGKQALMDGLLSGLSISIPESGTLNPAQLIPNKKEYWLEIGFGGGEHLAHQAGLHKDVGIIGSEPYIHGIAGLLKHINDNKLDNIRIYQQDARLLLDALPPESISRVYILYPDPWPKARHHKRRLVSKPTLDALARVMKKGAELRLATDDEDYCTWMLEQLQPHAVFTWTAKSCEDWLKPWDNWFSTRYEQKALAADRVPTYLRFIKNKTL